MELEPQTIDETALKLDSMTLSFIDDRRYDTTFDKTPTSIDGQLYEIKLVIWLLLKSFTEECHEFHLASNMKSGHKFDDIVFRCQRVLEKPKLIFLQTKHRDKEEIKKADKNKITINQLFSTSKKSDFGVVKYFDSYLKIKSQFSENKVSNPIFGSKFEDLDCDIVIYSNAQAAFNTKEGGGIEKLMNGVEKIMVADGSMLNFTGNTELERTCYYKIVPGNNKVIKNKCSVLKSISNSDDDIYEFFNQLKLFIGQPNQNEIGELIKQKIQKAFNVIDEDIVPVYSEIQSRVLKWWNEDNYYLTKQNRFLHDSIRISIRFDVRDHVPLFTGRKKALTDLHEILNNDGGIVISQAASVTGLGGIGKSELARKYISIYYKEYDDNIFWINAANYQTIEDSYRRLAKEKLKINTKDRKNNERDIETIVPEIYKYFAERHRKSLFIFDNAIKFKTYSDRDGGLDKFLPSGPGKPYVLITSRDQEWDYIKPLPLGVFSEPEAVKFIKKSLGIHSQSEDNDIKLLANTLHYLPLALEQAMAYIKRENVDREPHQKITINDYIEIFKTKAAVLFQAPVSEELADRYTGTIFTTWNVTIDKIKEKRDGETALKILDVLAYLAPDNVPIEFIFDKLIRNKEIRHSAVELLHQYSMAHLGYGMVNIHRLVQQVTRIGLTMAEQEESIFKQTHKLLGMSFPYGSTVLSDYPIKKQLLPHLEMFVIRVEELGLSSKDVEGTEKDYLEDLFIWLGHGYDDTGNPSRGKEILELAIPILSRLYGQNDSKVARTMANLGNAYGALGDYEKQKQLLEQVLKMQELNFGPDDVAVVKPLVNLSNAYADLGNAHKQMELLERALPIMERHYGPEHVEVATLRTNLGMAYGSLGDIRKRKEMIEWALPILENTYGNENIQIAKALVLMSNTYGEMGDAQKQKDLLEKALRIQEVHYGEEHFQVARSLVNLGIAYGNLGNPGKQKELLMRALQIEEKHYDSEHIEIAATLNALANSYGDLGDCHKEKELLERALRIEERYYGSNHIEVAKTLVNLSVAYENLGDPETQKDLLERALEIEENFYGHEHFHIGLTLGNLGIAYVDLGEHEKGIELFEKALSIKEAHYGPNHYEVSRTLVNLGSTYGFLGETEKEIELLERALKIDKSYYGSEHFEVAATLANLATAYGHLDDYQKKVDLLEQVLEIEKKHYGIQHFEVAKTTANLGLAYGSLGDREKRKNMLENALPILVEHYGSEHMEVAKILGNLALAYGDLGDTLMKKECLEKVLAIKEKHLGPVNFEVIQAMKILCKAYADLAEHEKQKELLDRIAEIKKNICEAFYEKVDSNNEVDE